MTLIGMMHHRADPEKVKKAYAYSVVAKAEGVEFFYFTPGKVDIENKKILGKCYENGSWIEKEYPFPDVIYNASYPLTSKAEEIVDYLYDRIPFTSHSIGSKLSVYKRIQRGKEFHHYQIPTIELTDTDILLDMLKLYSKVVVKPSFGHQGENVLFIEKEHGHFKMNDAGKISILTKNELLDFVNNKMKETDYIVQRFVTCKIKSGHVYDFRLHVQKNGEGKWVMTSIYPRIGYKGSITSNIGSGGYTAYLDRFLQNEFHDDWFNMKRELEHFSLSFANHFDTLFEGSPLDELGIDVGVDENKRLWLFEVNWRPGIPIIFNSELDVAKNTIHYAKYLAMKNKQSTSIGL